MDQSNASEMLVNTTRPSDRERYDARWCVSAISIAGLIGFILIGNVLVLMLLRVSKRLPAHYPLASLAVADLLVGLFVVPIAGVRELFVVDINSLICTFWKTLDVMCCTASILSLCLLGWERWRGIINPLDFVCRNKRARLYAGLLWPIALAVALPSAFLDTPKHHPGKTDKACPDNMNVTYVIVSAVLSFYLPASLLMTFYLRILHTLGIPTNIRAHRGQPRSQKISTIGGPGHVSPGGKSNESKKRKNSRGKKPQIPSCLLEELRKARELESRDLAALEQLEMELQIATEIKMRRDLQSKSPVPATVSEEFAYFVVIPEQKSGKAERVVTSKVPEEHVDLFITPEQNITESAKVPEIVPEEIVDLVAEEDTKSGESAKVVPEIVPEENVDLVAEEDVKSGESAKVVSDIVPEKYAVTTVALPKKKTYELALVVPETLFDEYEFVDLVAVHSNTSGLIDFVQVTSDNYNIYDELQRGHGVASKKKTCVSKQAAIHASRQRRASIMIMRVMALFLVCWTPFFVTLPIDAVCECVWDPIWQWATWLGYTNSALNPLAYALALFAFHQEMMPAVPSSTRSTEVPRSFVYTPSGLR